MSSVHLHLHMILTAALLAEPHQAVSIQPYRNTCKYVSFLTLGPPLVICGVRSRSLKGAERYKCK